MRYMPEPKREYVETFDNLTGGMNRFDLDYKLKGNESPFIQNLSWHNGTLCSRWGQVEVGRLPSGIKVVSPFLFHGWLLVRTTRDHYAYKLRNDGNPIEKPVGSWRRILTVQSVHGAHWTDGGGAYFRYREDVFYKARGTYARFTWDEATDSVTGTHQTSPSTLDENYTPVTLLNADPLTGAGDLYQPENRLSFYKTVKYNVPSTPVASYKWPYGTPNAPEDRVVVDGHELTEGYQYDVATGCIVFDSDHIPQPHDPPVNNTVEITLGVPNFDAYNSVMDSAVVTVFGGAQDLCVVMGGCDAQPNAFFWSGNNGLVMDPTYFPMSQYNLVGDNSDPITAFGKQQNMLVIFQPHMIGRATFGTEKVNDREQVTMNYTRINAEIGCDFPGSLQLVENNLVWCNRRYGVCRLRDSSAAYENNIVVISRKINGDIRTPGLLQEIKSVPADQVYSVDTGRKYIFVFGEKAYEWNYELSEYNNPSWFFHKGIRGMGFVPDANDSIFEVTSTGVIAEFRPVYMDFNQPIEKIYTFPPRNFGSYDRLKNIMSMIFTTRGDADTNTRVTYTCDYSKRVDPKNLVSHSWSLVPRNLEFRDLSCAPYSAVFRRKPGYHNIRHLGVQLYNDEAGIDLSIGSAQIFYNFRGRQR